MKSKSVYVRHTLREIMRIAAPAVVSNISVPLLSLVDTAITGHLGSQLYLGAIAVGGMIFNVLYWVMGFLRMGTSGLTAQAFGRKDACDISLQLARALFLALGIGLAFVLLSPLVSRLAFLLVSCPEGVEIPAQTYFRICILGAPAVLGIYAFSGWFLGMQNSAWPMAVAVVQNVANLVASMLLVFVFHLKIEGVAAGTVIGEYVGFALCCVVWARKYAKNLPKPNKKEIFNRREFARFLNVNRDIFLRTLLHVAVMSYFTVAGARMNATVLAANAMLMQLFVIFSYISDGFAFSAEALSGKYIGARDSLSFGRTIRVLAVLCCGVAVIFSAAYFIGGKFFLAMLTDVAETVNAAAMYLPFAALIPIVSFTAFLMDGIFVGATASRLMLVSAAVSAGMFFVVFFTLHDTLGNTALWIAFLAFLLSRSSVMVSLYPHMRRRAFGGV